MIRPAKLPTVRVGVGHAANGENVVLHLGDGVEVWLPWPLAVAIGQEGRRRQQYEARLARRTRQARRKRKRP